MEPEGLLPFVLNQKISSQRLAIIGYLRPISILLSYLFIGLQSAVMYMTMKTLLLLRKYPRKSVDNERVSQRQQFSIKCYGVVIFVKI